MPDFQLSVTRHFSSSYHPPLTKEIPLQASTFITPTSSLSLFPSNLSHTNTTTTLQIRYKHILTPHCSIPDTTLLKEENNDGDGDGDGDEGHYRYDDNDEEESDEEENCLYGEGLCVEIKKIGENSRRIRSKIDIDASLGIVWKLLTSYDNLADFIPGLAVSELIEKKGSTARLFQIGQQKLPLGFKFNAKAILDCYEKDLEVFADRERHDIEFKMIEGDFQLFEGKWSIEQFNKPRYEDSDISKGREFDTVLSYYVDVKPKLWLPVYLVEGILCKEIKTNLLSIREEAEKLSKITDQ